MGPRGDWPVEPAAACAALGYSYPGWRVWHVPERRNQPARYFAQRPRGPRRRSGVDAPAPWALAVGIETVLEVDQDSAAR